MDTRTQNTLVVVLGLLAVALAAGLVMALQSSDGNGAVAGAAAMAVPPRTQPIAPASRFSIVQNAASASELPADAQRQLGDELKTDGVDVDRAVAVPSTVFGGSVWVVPGAANVCLVLPDTEGYGVGCKTGAQAVAGQLVETLAGGDLGPHSVKLAMLVPDGVTNVSLTSADGRAGVLPVSDNVVTADATSGGDVGFVDPQDHAARSLVVPGA